MRRWGGFRRSGGQLRVSFIESVWRDGAGHGLGSGRGVYLMARAGGGSLVVWHYRIEPINGH